MEIVMNATVIKTKVKPRQKSLSSTLSGEFKDWRYLSGGRGIEITCSAEVFRTMGQGQWFEKVKAKVVEVAKSQDKEIATWLETLRGGVPTLQVNFTKVVANFNLDFQADLLADLQSPEHHNNHFEVKSVKVVGNKEKGYVDIEWESWGRGTREDAKRHLRETLKDLFARTYHKKFVQSGNKGAQVLHVMYSDLPDISEV